MGALEPEALGLLAFTSRKLRLRAGDRLVDAGEALDGALVIMSGEIELAAPGLPPRRVGPQTTLDELALFAPIEASADARAATDAVVMRVTRETMGRVLEEFPAAAPATRARVADQLARFAREARRVETP
ncbi:MAG: cyclic nucleotide-binding domain-containing protein [Rhodoblastus sp.]|nr:MAG: cyclic nucleotide-binding domain-containing protein [Rhodoblastus sp.]